MRDLNLPAAVQALANQVDLLNKVVVELRGRLEAHRSGLQTICTFVEGIGPLPTGTIEERIAKLSEPVQLVADEGNLTARIQYSAMADELRLIGEAGRRNEPWTPTVIEGGKED